MKIIGLTGGIGSGKSTVAGFLKEFGAYLIDADKIGHEAFRPGTPEWRDIVSVFGESILGPHHEINRAVLGKMVFGNPDAFARLNQIVHPRILEMVQSRLKELEQQGAGVVVLEVILLIEAGWKSMVDEIWVTVASQATILRRLKARNNFSEEESLTRIRAQSTNEERLKHADIVIDTNCTLEELKVKVKKLWDALYIK